MKVAVTGASGFIGGHVLRELVNRQVRTVAVTRDATRLSDWIASVQVVEMNIAEPGVHCFDQLGRPDVLIHLAWDGLPNYISLHHFEVELPKHYRFLKAMINGGLSALFVAGTCFEYGLQSGPLSEEMVPLPANPYGFAKNSLRKQLEFFQSSNPFKLTWSRLFYMYGEGQPKTSLYSQLRDAVMRGEKVFNMSPGEQLRDYLPVSEVARIVVDLAMLKKELGIVNICSGKPISIRKLVESWLLENNWDIQLNLGFYPYADYEHMAFWGSERKLRTLL